MKRLQSVVISFLAVIPATCFAQARRAPVYVSHAGHDSVGALFEAALNQELSRSILYIPRSAEGANGKFEFHIDLRTVDVADSKSEQGKRSVVSVVIEDFGLPNSYPVETMWYHKVIVVDKASVAQVAKDLLYDMGATWCSYNKNSVGGCPKEKFYPAIY
jgi:hypothetical protein